MTERNYYTPLRAAPFARGYRFVNKFGEHGNVGATFEDIWTAGGTYSFPESADIVSVVSTFSGDDSAGSAAREIRIEGLDQNFDYASDTIAMDGLTPVDGVIQFSRVYRAMVTECGTYGTTNGGDISISHKTSADLLAQIPLNYGQTEMSMFTVPNGHTGFIMNLNATVSSSNNGADIQLMTREAAGNVTENIRPYRVRASFFDVKNSLSKAYSNGIKIPEKTDIWFRAQRSGTGQNPGVDVEFEICLLPNEW